ncbi:unannotated protein [freshwater metagenome]|uniref:Unannotated protein n=1 Tax=freshwater metagenome TaxID=449393 RepID=A0A6J6MU01_9ZZZZ|nr:hypothetical protein [Actinomycetota bacterium]
MIGSSPVTVNVKVLLVVLPTPRRRVTTGARLSAATVVVVVVVVVVAATVVVVAAIDVVAATTVVVVATETIVHFNFWPDLAQINLVPPTEIILPAFSQLEPTLLAARAPLAPKPIIATIDTMINFFTLEIF